MEELPDIEFNVLDMNNVIVLCNGVEYGRLFIDQLTCTWTFISKFDGMTFVCYMNLMKSCTKVSNYIKQDFKNFMS